MLLEFEAVDYTYPCSQSRAIEGLSLQIPEGRRCAFIGRNGCGKTTLFRLANGLYRPQKGTIRLFGKPLRYDRISQARLQQQVGLVFQNPEQQLVATTVAEDISYGLCNLGLPNAEIARRVRSILEDFDLVDLADQPINYLSLGQKKRISIADVMVLQPQLLLLDEPTAYLDPYQVRNLRVMLDRIEAAGTTIAIATHHLDFVYAWAEWVYVIDGGRAIAEGTPDSVFQQDRIVKDLGLGRPLAINLLEAIAEIGLHCAIGDREIQTLQQRLKTMN